MRQDQPAPKPEESPRADVPQPPKRRTPTNEQLFEAGPALDWGGDPSRITG